MSTVMVTEMERKVAKIGNSPAITIPKEFLSKLNVALGDNVSIEIRDAVEMRDAEIVIRKSRKVQLPQGISSDFFDVINETMKEYDETLKGLRDR